jgi:TPR repeat protein
MEEMAPLHIQSVAPGPAGPRLSAIEVDALLARGDAFERTGDITSARLYYERAADAGSGVAALRMGATFEPLVSHRAGIGAAPDPAQALFWYRRARDLGINEAEERITRVEHRKDTRSDALSH